MCVSVINQLMLIKSVLLVSDFHLLRLRECVWLSCCARERVHALLAPHRFHTLVTDIWLKGMVLCIVRPKIIHNRDVRNVLVSLKSLLCLHILFEMYNRSFYLVRVIRCWCLVHNLHILQIRLI